MKRRNFWVRNYLACWDFFCESRWYVVFALGVFALLFLVGFLFPVFFREEIFAFIAELTAMLEEKGTLELIWMIFFNNLKAGFFAMVLGIGVGLFPLFAVVVNGYLLGFVAREAVNITGIGVLWQLAPHGIFELPAIIFSIGIGFKIGVSVFGGRGVGDRLRYNFREAMRFFVFVVIPLLVIAGIIEGILIGVVG